MSTNTPSASSVTASQAHFIAFSLVAALIAAAAAFASVSLTLPLWAMFVGWVAFFTRPPSIRNGATNIVCVLLGVLFGMVAAWLIRAFMPILGVASFPIVVFVVATVVVSLRAAPVFNNVLNYFLGLIAFFASQQAPALAVFAELSASCILGAFAAWLSNRMQLRLAPAPGR
jgi:hypothetical protein